MSQARQTQQVQSDLTVNKWHWGHLDAVSLPPSLSYPPLCSLILLTMLLVKYIDFTPSILYSQSHLAHHHLPPGLLTVSSCWLYPLPVPSPESSIQSKEPLGMFCTAASRASSTEFTRPCVQPCSLEAFLLSPCESKMYTPDS